VEADVRCFYLRNGQVNGVTFLKAGSDEELIQQAKRLFEERTGQKFEGFEVWNGDRLIYRSSPTSPS
jgi:hypothetical protein